MSFPVFFDTCALYGAALNDTLLRLAEHGIYRPIWSADVLAELERNLAERVGSPAARRRVAAMASAFPDASVEGYHYLVPTMTCDAKDRHVLAAAVRSGAAVLVTFNTADFPAESYEQFALDVVHPDDFLLDQIDLHEQAVRASLAEQVDSARNPPLTLTELLAALSRAGVTRFATRVAQAEYRAEGDTP